MTTEITPIKPPWELHGLSIYEPDKWQDGNNLGGRKIAVAYDSDLPNDLPGYMGQLTDEEQDANAKLIVQAVNSHETLVNALIRIAVGADHKWATIAQQALLKAGAS